MKKIIILDSCINSDSLNPGRIKQYENGLKSFFRFEKFFIDNDFDILLVDNSIDNLDSFPVFKIIPEYVKKITRNNNEKGRISKSAGVFEHWLISKDIWKNYDYLIHFEIRQVIENINFFEEFIKEPMSMFGWCTKVPYRNKRWKKLFPPNIYNNKDPRFQIEKYGRDNSNVRSIMFNDFYTGLMCIEIKEFLPFVENYNLDSIIKDIPGVGMKSLENIMMSYAYEFLPKFKIVERLYITRYSSYNSLDNLEHY